MFETLAAHGAALCVHDILAEHPWRLTASWTYLRYHGPSPSGRYAHSYAPRKLAVDADRIVELLTAGRDVYAYFNNDLDGHAVHDAQALRRYVQDRLGRA